MRRPRGSGMDRRGSLFLTRPTLKDYYAGTKEFTEGTKAFLGVVTEGIVKVAINQTYRLRDVQKAHRDLDDRKTTGSTVLLTDYSNKGE